MPKLALVSSAAASWPTWWRVVTEFAFFLAVASVIGGTLTYLAVVRPVLRATEMGIEDADVVVMRRRSATLLAWSGLALVGAAYFQLASGVARADGATSLLKRCYQPRCGISSRSPRGLAPGCHRGC
ncbi:MAG: hypothetical protein QOJ06_3105 [Pseudonocardiales bacterium]|nr:hypothetical protein [Pseudonocardiales bacterium]